MTWIHRKSIGRIAKLLGVDSSGRRFYARDFGLVKLLAN
jgi:hypothetical protein